MIDYKNGKIYKLISINTDKIYIGKTCQPLKIRYYDHKSKNPFMEYGNVEIKLIEDFPCTCSCELAERERYYYELYKKFCVNKNIPNRCKKEYYKDNRQKKIDYQTKYNKDNKKKIKIYNRESYWNSEVGRLRRINYQKIYNKDNKERIKIRIQFKKDQLEFIKLLMNMDIN